MLRVWHFVGQCRRCWRCPALGTSQRSPTDNSLTGQLHSRNTKEMGLPVHPGSDRWKWVNKDRTSYPSGGCSTVSQKVPRGFEPLLPKVVSRSSMHFLIDFYLLCLSSWNHLPNRSPEPKSLSWDLFWRKPKLRQAMSEYMCGQPKYTLLYSSIGVECPRLPSGAC